MCDDGLFRDEREIRLGLMNSLFPGLFNHNEKYTAGLITKTIKENLPQGDCSEWLKFWSSRSIRRGPINKLAMHSDANIFMVSSRSGHKIQQGFFPYLDRKNPVRGLPAALALHDHKHVKGEVILPNLTAVGSLNQQKVRALLKRVFAVNIPAFMPATEHNEAGRLFVVLEICLASLIRHYNNLTKVKRCRGETNVIVDGLLRHAEAVRVTEAGQPNLSCHEVLCLWSNRISSDCTTREEAAALKTAGGSNGDVNTQLLVQVLSSVRRLEEISKDNETKISDLIQSNINLERKNKSLSDKLSQIYRTPERDSRKRTRTDLRTDDLSHQMQSVAIDTAQAPPPAAADAQLVRDDALLLHVVRKCCCSRVTQRNLKRHSEAVARSLLILPPGWGSELQSIAKGQDRQGASSGFKACGSEVDFRGESERIRR